MRSHGCHRITTPARESYQGLGQIVRKALKAGTGIRKVARELGIGTSVAQRVKAVMDRAAFGKPIGTGCFAG